MYLYRRPSNRELFGKLFKSNPETIDRIGRNLASQKIPLSAAGTAIESVDLADDILHQIRHHFADAAAS